MVASVMRFASKLGLSFTFLCILAITSACNQDTRPKSNSRDGLPILSFGHAEVSVELAIDPATQAKGLMYRDSLPENQGMLFVFDRPKQMSFWMRNTHIPLDIGYFTTDGILREIYPLYPHDETSRRSIRSDLLFALEVNQGWYEKYGVKPGDKFDPSDFID